MRPLKAAFFSVALLASAMSLGAPAMADTAAVDPAQVSTLVNDIDTAINASSSCSSVSATEAAINAAIAKDGFSTAVVSTALRVVQSTAARNSCPSVGIAVASLETAVSGGTIAQGGGVSGGSPIGGLVSGSSGGSGYVGP
jgi:hypothetical protein